MPPLWPWCLGEMGSETDSMELTGGRQGWEGRRAMNPLLPAYCPWFFLPQTAPQSPVGQLSSSALML